MNRIVPVYFEVMDKEPAIGMVWLVAVVIAVAGYFAGRWRWWAALPFVAVALLLAWGRFAELGDPSFGPAIRAEAGVAYVVQSYVTAVLAVVGPLLGLRRRRAV